MREFNFDGLVGPTHNYGGLSPGNLASAAHKGLVSNPRAAALQGIAKMRFVHALGVGQAALPPHQRPHVLTLRRLGLRGSDEEVIAAAAQGDGQLLRLCSSASAMWAANAATVAPSADTNDGRVHFTPANLTSLFHRAIEPPQTARILRAIFADERFVVHEPLPGGAHFSDEGAANHTRLFSGGTALHVFAWGRRTWPGADGMPRAPARFPARQTYEASEAVARLHDLRARVRLAQQHPDGIDGGAFHSDVLSVGAGDFWMLHELAFLEGGALVEELRRALPGLRVVTCAQRELPVEIAVASYAFNSQVLDLPDGRRAVVAPLESREAPEARAFLERVASETGVAVHYLDVRQSMQNGGGPACLRLRVPLEDAEIAAVRANVFVTESLCDDLEAWVHKHYRDSLAPGDLADPALAREGLAALDEVTRLLRLGAIYDFQK